MSLYIERCIRRLLSVHYGIVPAQELQVSCDVFMDQCLYVGVHALARILNQTELEPDSYFTRLIGTPSCLNSYAAPLMRGVLSVSVKIRYDSFPSLDDERALTLPFLKGRPPPIDMRPAAYPSIDYRSGAAGFFPFHLIVARRERQMAAAAYPQIRHPCVRHRCRIAALARCPYEYSLIPMPLH